MVKVNLVAVGKVKEKYFLDGINEYKKRLSAYCDFNLIEVAEENFKSVNESQIGVILEREGERILPNLRGYVAVLAIEGKRLSSTGLASLIKRVIDLEGGVITFVIGGSYGVSEKIKKRADMLLSFSDMTFPHTLFRLMTTEQIYRAFTINAGSAYHK